MQKKIKIEILVEPATTAGGYSQFIDNIKEFVAALSKYGVPDIGQQSFDLDIVHTNAKICDEQNWNIYGLTK